MTESEWLACESPRDLAAFARGRVPPARFRWLAVEWGGRVRPLMQLSYRRVFDLFVAALAEVAPPADPWHNFDVSYYPARYTEGRFVQADRCASAIHTEDFALGAACAAEAAIADAVETVRATRPAGLDFTTTHRGRSAANRRATEAALLAAQQAHEVAIAAAEADARREIGRAFSAQFRCAAGDPFRPAALDPAWLSPDAIGLARAAFASADFSLLPVLADALEEAGCDSADLLGHLRGVGVHVRGCWALEWARAPGDSV